MSKAAIMRLCRSWQCSCNYQTMVVDRFYFEALAESNEKLAEALEFYQATSRIPLEATIKAYNTGDTVMRDYQEYCRKAREALAEHAERMQKLTTRSE